MKPGPKQPADLSCLISLGARTEGQQLQRVKHVLHRGEWGQNGEWVLKDGPEELFFR